MKLLLKFALVLCLCAGAQAEVAVPPLKAHVTDLTGTLSADERAGLEKGLQALEARNGSQIAVLMVPTTQPETIEQYSIRVAEAWKLGKKGVDNGLLLLVAKDDRKVRIEVGYGLEGVIPDVVAHRVIDETITPLFKDGEYMRGIVSGLFRLEALIDETSQSAVATVTVPGGMEIPHFDPYSYFLDLTGTISNEQSAALCVALSDYRDLHAISILVLVVPTSQPETAAQLATRALKTWGSSRDNLTEINSVLLLVSQKEHSAQVVVGAHLLSTITDDAGAVVVRSIQPLLEKGDLHGAVQSGIQQIQTLLVNQKISLSERIISTLTDLPTWLIISLMVAGTALRWFIGPFLGGLILGAVVGCGAWFVFESVDVAIFAGIAAFAGAQAGSRLIFSKTSPRAIERMFALVLLLVGGKLLYGLF